MTDREFLIWAAGFFEGDGSVQITKNKKFLKYNLQINITNTQIEPLNIIQNIYGGRVRIHGKETDEHKESYRWVATQKIAEKFLDDISPFILYRHKQVKIGLDFIKNKTCGYSLTSEELLRRERLYLQMKELNKRGPISEEIMSNFSIDCSKLLDRNDFINWLAGYFEAEGHVSIKKMNDKGRKNIYYQYALSSCLTNSILSPLLEIQSRYNYLGGIYIKNHGTQFHKKSYRLEMTGYSAKNIIQDILPYLTFKRERAELAITIMDNMNSKTLNTDKELEKREFLYLQLKEMNKRGPVRIAA